MAEYVSLIISLIATLIALIGIFQTKRTIKMSSNQFLFDKRLEIINLYEAIIYVGNEVANVEITNEEGYFTDVISYKERSKDLTSRINLDFSMITNHALFYDLYKFSESVSTDKFDQERINVLLFRNNLNEFIAATNYLFSDKDLQLVIKDVLTIYESILRLYIAIFLELNNIKSNGSIGVVLLTHKKIFNEVEKLKLSIRQIEVQEMNSRIAKELEVF